MLLWPGATLSLVLSWFISYQALAFNPTDWRFTLTLRQYEQVRDALLNVVGRTTTSNRLLNDAGKLQKLQPTLTESEPFPCQIDGFRSDFPPESIDRLRPGDVDVVAALGDSLTAGNGAAASNIFHVYTENRGISWTGDLSGACSYVIELEAAPYVARGRQFSFTLVTEADVLWAVIRSTSNAVGADNIPITVIKGGQGSWRQFLTIPNMLKEFNPRLVGYALKDSLSHHRASQFNVGEAGAMSNDLPYMAGQLIKRIRSDARINIEKDWKLITVMMGSNDFCVDICYVDTKTSPERHRKNLIKALEKLKRALPRTLVQIVISPNLGQILTQFRGTRPLCKITHSLECPCLFGLANQNRMPEFLELIRLWQLAEFKVASDPRFTNTDDFAVVAQPFTYNISFPLRKDRVGNKLTDFTYLSEDCFHFSQKGYSRAVTALWNNMLQPVGQKSTNWGPEFQDFKCPSESSPYIFTNRNS